MIDTEGYQVAKNTARLQDSLRMWRAVAISALVLVALLGVADLTFLRMFRGRLPQPGDPRLVGTWQSDRAATVEKIRTTRRIEGEALKTLEAIYGKMRVTYTDTSYSAVLDDTTETGPFEVVGKNDTSVILKGYSTLTKRYEFSRIVFADDNTFWIHTGEEALPECFRRVK
jgi:hypothetical protein